MFTIKDLKMVVINVSNVCNLKCPYCPNREDNFRKTNLYYGDYMSIKTIKKIKESLDKIDYKGEVSITGFGEPLLNPHICEICEIMGKYKPNLLTNGTIIYDGFDNYAILKEKTHPIVTLHNEEAYGGKYSLKALEGYFWLLEWQDGFEIRNHNTNDENNTLIANNRGGLLDDIKSTPKRHCYYPFYEIFIDIDGSYLICAHDWGRRSRMKRVDIYHMDIEEYFLDKYSPVQVYREEIKNGHRDMIIPCRLCNADGEIEGEKEYNHYCTQE